MNYDDAVGYLIGAKNKGLNAMFVMMNEARLGVGLQGLSVSEIAYQNAANYARDRLQGRSISGVKASDKKADPIIVHPDVRRTLMTIKAFNEAGRAFTLWTALKSDIAHRGDNDADRQTADDILGLMTPILKGVLTDKGFDHAVMAQQVFGGHGYIEEHGMSQYVRDARIAMIYEGANGIQALDLVGRKLALNGGRAITALFKEIGDFCEENRSDEKLTAYTKGLKKGLNDLQAATMWFMGNAMAKPDNAGAGSTDYMHLFGLVVLGYMWAKIAKTAEEKTGGRCRRARDLPEEQAHHRQILHGAHHAGNSAAQSPHRNRRRHDDGTGRSGVLSKNLFSPAGRSAEHSEAMRGSYGNMPRSWLPLIRPCGPPSPRWGEEEARPIDTDDARSDDRCIGRKNHDRRLHLRPRAHAARPGQEGWGAARSADAASGRQGAAGAARPQWAGYIHRR